jgi:Leucine rich repeat/Leucine Rich repeat
MSGQGREKLGWRTTTRILTHYLAMGLVVVTGCQGFPGTLPSNPTGILGDDVLSTVVTGMSPAEANQLKQHRLALQIKKAGGDVNINMALYPASTVVGVDLHQTQVLDADLLQLRAFPNLRTLNLYGTHITDAGLESIAPLRSLQTLRLANTEITDAGLQSLQKLPDLRELGLTHTKVTDQGMAMLSNMKTLTELTLSGSQITDAGLKQLKVLTHLRKLVLIKTSVTKAGIEQFQRAVPDAHVFAG